MISRGCVPTARVARRPALLRTLRRAKAAAPARRRCITAAAKKKSFGVPNTPAEAVNKGLELFEEGNVQGALVLFEAAQEMNPNNDEARAAYYNAACCLTKLRKWEAATAAIETAVEKHDLKLIAALEDDDLAALRDTSPWIDLVGRLRGGRYAPSAQVELRTEAAAPFRFARIFILGGLAAGAALGLLVILGRLAAAVQGGEGAPDLAETLGNAGVNAGVLGVLLFFVRRDLQARERDKKKIQREEDLGRLQVELPGGRTVALSRLRGNSRPVVLAGSRADVLRATRGAQKYKQALQDRGIVLVPVIFGSEDDPSTRLEALRSDFEKEAKESKGFDKEAPGAKGKGGRWEVKPVDLPRWSKWIKQQMDEAKIASKGDMVFVQVQLTGEVRSSGVGSPKWDRFVTDLPLKDSREAQIQG
ncbi:unnamed protein product [Pedinophyceae sp. YPF-701]|nr:unnamed protein product [Pedinophyceae sp. YPF-701]